MATLLVPGGKDGSAAYSASLLYARATLVSSVLIEMERGIFPKETISLRSRLLSQFRSWKVESLVAILGGMPKVSQTIAFFTWLFGRPPEVRDQIVLGWYKLRV